MSTAEVRVDHVALLVSRLETCVERLQQAGVAVPVDWAQAIESFPGEGTRELYLGPEGTGTRLLLMEALPGEGPYARALAKRGPGLHHLGLEVEDPVVFARGSGWLVHPSCLESFPEGGCLWLARPGVGCLLEVQRGKAPESGHSGLVEGVAIPVAAELAARLRAPFRADPPPEITSRGDGAGGLRLGGRWLDLDELVGP